MNGKKVILLVRVSTVRQEIETQKKELVEYAKADRFSEEDMVIIQGVGASAVKLNDVYLAEMEQLYKRIEEGDVEAVYAWEISRIGRNEEILMKFKNTLIEKGIQLVIKNPSLRLLNSDGSVNNGVELAFSLFATMSKQEMQIKKERFARAKARSKAEGKYLGGRIKLGYKLDANKRFKVDEEKAEVVRDVFNWYVNEGLSLRKIFRKLNDMGIYASKDNLGTNASQASYILRDRGYIGEGMYEQIVDREIFEKAQKMLSEIKKPHVSKNIYFCKGLLKDKNTGFSLSVRSATLSYITLYKDNPYSVNINVMDFICEYSSDIFLAWRGLENAQKGLAEYTLKIEENNGLIKFKTEQIAELEKGIERAVEMNVRQPKYFPTEKMEQVIRQNEVMIDKLKTEIADLETVNTRLKQFIEGNQKYLGSLKGLSDDMKFDMIHDITDKILIDKYEFGRYHIEVFSKMGESLEFEYYKSGNVITLTQVYKDGRVLDLTSKVKKYKRLERKRYEK